MPDSTKNDDQSAKIAKAAREAPGAAAAEPADLDARRRQKREREAAAAEAELARARAKARAARAALAEPADGLPQAANDTDEAPRKAAKPVRPEAAATFDEGDTTGAQTTGGEPDPVTDAERAARRARRKAREEKDRKRRERDLELLQKAEEKKKEPSVVSNGWMVVKMALGFGAGGWALATMIFGILMGLEGSGLLAIRLIFALLGAAGGVYVYLRKRDWFNKVMNDE